MRFFVSVGFAVALFAASAGAAVVDDPAYDSVSVVSRTTADEKADLGDCGCCPSSGCTSRCCQPCWTITTDAVFLDRSSLDFSFITGDPFNNVQSTRQFAFETGWQIDIVGSSSGDRELEIRYLGIDNWSSQIQYFNLLGPGDVRYSSDLYSTEINVRWPRPSNPYVKWLMGFRWVELNENFDTVPPGLSWQNDVDTRNHMYGFQLGALVNVYDVGGPLRVNADFRVGVYRNHINRSQTQATFGGIVVTRTQFNNTAFLGEIDLNATYQLREQLALRFGYQMLWLDGVALASDNFLAGANVKGGTLFCHGVNAGFEVWW